MIVALRQYMQNNNSNVCFINILVDVTKLATDEALTVRIQSNTKLNQKTGTYDQWNNSDFVVMYGQEDVKNTQQEFVCVVVVFV